MTNTLFGALTVLVTTNFVGVTFAPIPCTHPGCTEGHHSYTATERYMVVRDTWAEVVGTGENRRIYSNTNDWGSLSHPVAHPSVYHMHTQPGWAVRPGTRWPLDLPPLPPWEWGFHREPKPLFLIEPTGTTSTGWRRSNTATLPSDTNHYGVLYNVTSNYPPHKLVLEKRATDRGSGVRVWEGDGVVRYTNPLVSVTSNGAALLIWPSTNAIPNMDSNPVQRFQAIPATNALPHSRRFAR